MAIFLKDKPVEIWDVQALTLLRQMKDSFPVATAMVKGQLKSANK